MFQKTNAKHIISISTIILMILVIIIVAVFFNKIYNQKSDNKIVNIVFNTDAMYTEYTKVAIKSAIMTKSRDSVYNINVLCVDLPQKKMNEFKTLENKRKNALINLIPLKIKSLENIGNYQMETYVSRADLFKFLMPDLFPDLDKILYIDSDTIILKDLTELYNTDISKKYIGAVMRYDYDEVWVESIFHNWYWKKEYTYNCGVLLFNLKKWREDNIKEKLIIAKNNDLIRDLATQRSFNEVITLNNIKKLSPIYNTFSKMTERKFREKKLKIIYWPYLNNINSAEELFKNAVIVHFAGHKKPWSYKNVKYANMWWYYAKKINPKWELEPDRTH